MKKLSFLFIAIHVFSSCTDKNTQASTQAAAVAPVKATAQSSLKSNQQLVTYQSCTVYTGVTNYFFKTKSGETLQIDVSNEAIAKPTVKVPKNLIDPHAEALPGENPALVGKPYVITYDKNKQPIEVAPFVP